ncbi:MAG TPA: sigma-70 family RNA polymerase sigma factor [Thermomicrobiales bacterium]|nr:sigma-70 family RNA polymerase sigma factor [Thermomicrobiales bacterium]
MSAITPPPDMAPLSPERTEEMLLVTALRNGDEAAFEQLVDRYHLSLGRLARAYVSDPMVAEEVVQETWLALVRGIHRFEGRSSLKTWLFRVLTYQANHRATVEHHAVSFSGLNGPVLSSDRFFPEGHRWAGHWVDDLADWHATPEDALLERETLAHIQSLIQDLPPRQRAVVVMKDIEGLDAVEICEVLHVTDGTQRVLLHRARSRIREGLATYLREG